MITLTSGFSSHPLSKAVQMSATTRGGLQIVRQAILIQLLAFCSEGHVFKTAKQFAMTADLPVPQVCTVWEVCLERGVLTEEPGGFSARQWLIDNDMLTDVRSNTPNLPPTRVQGCEVDNHAPEDEKAQEGAKLSQQSPSTTSKPSQGARAAFFGNKKAVRPNVFLSDREMNTLRSQFTSEQIERMLDTLSDYKMAKNRDYASDYNAITRWVVKTLEENQVQTNTATYTPPRAYREITPEEDFKTSHGGMTRQEWDDYQKWANSEEGKKEIEQKKALLRAAVGL